MFRTTCRNIRDLLPLHVGGDLEPRRAAAVDEHLHRCLGCFREYREYLSLRGTLGVLAEQPLPEGALDGFVEEVMARIAVAEAGPRAELPAIVTRAAWLPRLAAAAALLVTASLGWLVWDASRPGALAPEASFGSGSVAGGSAARRAGETLRVPDGLVVAEAPGAADADGVTGAVPLSGRTVRAAPAGAGNLEAAAGGSFLHGSRGPGLQVFLPGNSGTPDPGLLLRHLQQRGLLVLPDSLGDGGLVPESGRVLRPRDPADRP